MANTGVRLDYVVSLDGHMAPADDGAPTRVGLRYVPDRLVLDPAALGRYLGALGATGRSSLEAVAAMILDDVSNEVVPRWVKVTVSAPDAGHPGIDHHGVMLEDRQPGWDNPALLSRLRKY
jgi:7-cyano-7-deazaguanine reductase